MKPSQQKSAKPHALCCQAHAKLVPSKALFLPSWPWAPFLVWRKPTLPCQAIAPSTLYIILICEKKTRSPGRERGITRSPGRERGDSRILSHGRGHWNRKESWPTYNDLEGLLAPGMKEPVKGTQHFRGAPSGAGWMGTRLTESGPGELHHAGMDAEAALPPWPRVLRKSIHCTSVGRIRDTLGRVKA